jgi:hypothetical protein
MFRLSYFILKTVQKYLVKFLKNRSMGKYRIIKLKMPISLCILYVLTSSKYTFLKCIQLNVKHSEKVSEKKYIN